MRQVIFVAWRKGREPCDKAAGNGTGSPVPGSSGLSNPFGKDVPLQHRHVVISGCSGGGKSTLVAELARRGHPVVEEPGRRIIAEERAGSGAALPWVDPSAFALRAVAMARADLGAVAILPGWVFFDRGLVDAAVALQHIDGVPVERTIGPVRFHPTVFLVPPWPEIYRTDADRRHGFEAAVAEYDRLLEAWRRLGYRLSILPRISPGARADHVLAALSAPGD